MSEYFNKTITGLLVIEVVNSNPNGDPDRESEPRTRDGDFGEISDVSFKRKLRDLIEWGPGSQVYDLAVGKVEAIKGDYDFKIFESRERSRISKNDILKNEIMVGQQKGSFSQDVFLQSPFVKKYWDARLFGNTFLEESTKSDDEKKGKKNSKGKKAEEENTDEEKNESKERIGCKETLKTGIVQFGLGTSVAPIVIERQTRTSKAGVQEGLQQGMAPLAYKIVQHGVYVMPFFIRSNFAKNTGCKECDIELLKNLIPFAYEKTASEIRADVRIRHAWWMEHKNAIGSCPDFLLTEALMPKRKGDDPMAPSRSWADYEVPTQLPPELADKVILEDLVSKCYM